MFKTKLIKNKYSYILYFTKKAKLHSSTIFCSSCPDALHWPYNKIPNSKKINVW